ncbi:multidrug DMT transporter permease [Legionella sp. W05-934-2]|jgi:Golgi nucleoside diphosphatase|uniref:multidrug DMT transporter permease n=1 Tax=Legionella sp. W05-934-2 TaxID=1198649 RepID=UPI00346263BA
MRLSARIVLLLSLLLVCSLNFAQSLDCQQSRCIAVIDAGSTGSRLHIYQYDVDETNTPIHIAEKWSKSIKPGFATIQANQATMDAYLTTLFSQAPNQSIPVFFYATAGMRLLPKQKQQERYHYLKNWFATQSQWKLADSRTLTGTEEGLFGWLAINYQLGTFNSESSQPVGVMDMGGASVQIAFPVDENTVDSSDVKSISVHGQSFKLFIKSFLGLGQTEVSHQFLNSAPCFITDYELPDGQHAKGDAYTCEKEVSPLMNTIHHVNRIIQPMLQANTVSRWYAMGGIATLAKHKPFTFQGSQFTNESLLAQADTAVCHQQWLEMQRQYPNDEYLFGYCLFPSYYYALMVEGYGLDPNQPIQLLNDTQETDWTIGVVIRQTPDQ